MHYTTRPKKAISHIFNIRLKRGRVEKEVHEHIPTQITIDTRAKKESQNTGESMKPKERDEKN